MTKSRVNPYADLENPNANNPYADLQKPIEEKTNFLDLLKKAVGYGKSGLLSNVAGGALHGLQGMAQGLAPDLSDAFKDSKHNPLLHEKGKSLIDTFDAYKATGTEDQPISTLGGAEQTLGELLSAGGAIKKGISSLGRIGSDVKQLGSKISARYNAPKISSENISHHDEIINDQINKVKNYDAHIANETARHNEKLNQHAEKMARHEENIINHENYTAQHANNLLNELGQGAENTSENSRNLAKVIMSKADPALEKAKTFYDYPLKQAGDERIFEAHDPLRSTKEDEAKKLLDRFKKVKTGAAQKAFETSQTFKNAHTLQASLGSEIGRLEKIPDKSTEETLNLEKIRSLRNHVKESINNFLERRDKTSNHPLASKYKQATDSYREDFSHFLPDMADVVKGRETNIGDIHNIFKNPTDKDEALRRVLKDLPEEAKGQVIFSKIGGTKNINNPEKIYKTIEDSKNEGFSDYFTPRLREALKEGKDLSNHGKKLLDKQKDLKEEEKFLENRKAKELKKLLQNRKGLEQESKDLISTNEDMRRKHEKMLKSRLKVKKIAAGTLLLGSGGLGAHAISSYFTDNKKEGYY